MQGFHGLSLSEAAAFHGHKGPWLVLGYRVGLRAVEVLKPETEHDLNCLVKTPLKTPYTCAIDGVQASARCTLGKLNIKLERSDVGEIKYIFTNNKTREKIGFKLKPEIKRRIKEILTMKGLEGAGEWVAAQPFHVLFEEKL